MNKFKKNLDYLKQRNSGMFDFKKNVLNTINELKEKNYTYNNNKKFSLIYLMSILLVLSFFIKGENTTSSLLSEIDRESSGIQKRVINRDINKSKYAEFSVSNRISGLFDEEYILGGFILSFFPITLILFKEFYKKKKNIL